MEQAEKRPTSPHITSATPTSARHHLPFSLQQSQKQSTSRSASFHEHDVHPSHQAHGQSAHRVASPSLLNSGIGRAAVSAAQSIMDAMAGRSSPVTLRSAHPSQDGRDSLSDDEAGKGHGRKAAASVAARFTPSIYHPRHPAPHHHAASLHDKQRPTSPHAIGADIAWRASISESRRATPAAYRPQSASANRRRNSALIDQQPAAIGDDSTDMHLPNSYKSTHSSITIGSPIVIPQARRGAVRLRPSRKRRITRQVKPTRTFRQTILISIATLAHFFRLLASPTEAFRRFTEYCIDTRIAIDDAFRDPQTGLRSYYPPWLQAYVPLLIWLGISLSSTALVITFHTQVFVGLDHMSTYLQGLGLWGKVMLGSLIFLTTFPPLPLYSTLIMLCGFTFGLWQGFIISYIAALSGAIVVFTLSRSLLREWMVGLLNKSGGLKKVVRAIEKQPKLLFLVRLAPYPYNLMNTLLASSPTLTLRTYVTCTALALPKLLIHTGLGTSIKNFAAYNGAGEAQSKEDAQASQTAEHVKKWAGLIGAGLCFGIMIYLLSVARRAVDELDDEGADGYYDDDVLYDDQDEELLSTDDDDERHDGDDSLDHGQGVDMRERVGPSTLGFRNGYAPITSSPEERFRQSMRHPQAVPGPLVLPGSSYDPAASGSGSFDGSASVGNRSVDLVDKIAEMAPDDRALAERLERADADVLAVRGLVEVVPGRAAVEHPRPAPARVQADRGEGRRDRVEVGGAVDDRSVPHRDGARLAREAVDAAARGRTRGVDDLADGSDHRVGLGHVGGDHCGLSAQLGDLRQHGSGRLRIADQQHDVAAGFGQRQRKSPADAAVATGDQHGPTCRLLLAHSCDASVSRPRGGNRPSCRPGSARRRRP